MIIWQFGVPQWSSWLALQVGFWFPVWSGLFCGELARLPCIYIDFVHVLQLPSTIQRCILG